MLGELGATLGVVTSLAEFGDRLGQLPLFNQGDAEVVVGQGVVGREPDRRAEFGDRLLRLPLVSQGDAEVVVGLGGVGLEPDRRAEFGDRLLRLPLGLQGGAEVDVGVGVVGLEPDRRAEFGDRLLQLPLDVQSVAEVDVGLGVVGLEPDRRAEFGDRLLRLPLVSQGVAEVDVGVGVVGREPDRRAEFGDRLLQLPWACRAFPRLLWAMARLGVSRIAVQNSATASSSFPWAPRAMPRLLWASAKSGLSRIAVRNSAIASASFPWACRALPRLMWATASAVCCPRLFPNQRFPKRVAPMAATAEASVSLRRARPGDDGLTGGIPVLSPWVPDRRQRGHRPAGSSAESGPPHTLAVETIEPISAAGTSAESGPPHRGQVARFASDMGSASVAGLQGGRDVLSPSGTSNPSSSYPKIGGQVSGSGWATASECTQTRAKRVPKTCARPFQRVQKTRAEFLSVEESLGTFARRTSTVRAGHPANSHLVLSDQLTDRCAKNLTSPVLQFRRKPPGRRRVKDAARRGAG